MLSPQAVLQALFTSVGVEDETPWAGAWRVLVWLGTLAGQSTRDAGAAVNTRPHNFHSFSLYLKLPWRNAFRAFALRSERSSQGV